MYKRNGKYGLAEVYVRCKSKGYKRSFGSMCKQIRDKEIAKASRIGYICNHIWTLVDFHIENITPKFVRETIEFIERFNRFPSVDDVEVIKDYNKYVPFNELALGAKFKFNYYNIPIYVKISHDTYADWSNELIDKNWVGQGVYGFDEEIKTDDDVWLIEQ